MTNWGIEMMHPNWSHQDTEFEEHRDDIARALHWQMRTGKTKAMVDLACYLYAQGRIDGVLVLASNNVHANWTRREVPEHHWLQPYKSLAWNTAASKSITYDVEFGKLLDYPGLAWYAVNVEATVLNQQRPYLKAFIKRRKFLLITDETHNWRRPGSKRSRYIRQHVAPKAQVRRNLSGTMIDNNPLHAYAQFEILSKGALGFTDYKAFEKHFGIWEEDEIYIGGKPRTVPKLVGFRNQDELRERMLNWTSFVYRDECDDMPELIRTAGEFDMTPEQKRIYNGLVQGALIRLETGELVAEAEGSSLLTRLQQVASGYVKDEDGETHDIIPIESNPRLSYLVDEVRSCDGKVVIWCRFRKDIENILARFRKEGIIAVDYYGGTAAAQRPRNEDRFRNDPIVKAMVAQPKACGEGLDFSAGTFMVWYSHLHGDLIAKRQADERCTKKGGRKIAITEMVARGTVDTKILSDNSAKAVVADYLTGEGLREYLRIVA